VEEVVVAAKREGVVSVILVNFRGAPDTIEAIRGLGELDWPSDRLEIVVVENASGDDSAAVIAAAAPQVVLVRSATNLGFAGGCNLGVSRSTGEFVAFLNNDARPDRRWVAEAVAKFDSSPRVGAVASKVLDWEGTRVDFIGAGLTWFGMGYKPLTGEIFQSSMPESESVLFGTGSAMFVRRSVFDELGGFDESFFMFFEDVDLGWRLNLLGHRYAYAPLSIAFHKHHASMDKFGSFKETYLLERNALYCMYKNLGNAALAQALPAALALSVRRGIAKGDLDSTAFDIRKPGGDSEQSIEISKQTAAGIFAVDQFVQNLPALRDSRRVVQSTRVVSDSSLWRLFGETDAPSFDSEYYLDGYLNVASTFDVLEPPRRTRVLIVTGDPIGAKLAGPAIRAWSMAEALAVDNDVTLASLAAIEAISAPFELTKVASDHEFAPLEAWADVIIFQGHAMAAFSSLKNSLKIIVADIYDPMHLEQLEQSRELPRAVWDERVQSATAVLNQQLQRADYLICASDRQRIFYLGQLAALGRINPANYEHDPDLSHLIDVVPFGLPRVFPKPDRHALKGVLPGIEVDDKVLLWGGGLYSWFDPKTLIRAVALIAKRRPDVKLFFQGTKHPHPGVPEMAIVAESRDLAKELGVLDSAVFFNDSWVDFADRHNYLSDADAGVSTHFDHLETTMSFRTRILDYLWAGLPMVVTEGDYFAEIIDREHLGIVVPADDVASLSAALEKVLFDTKFASTARKNVARVRKQFYWDIVLAPLVEFVRSAKHAPDLAVAIASGKTILTEPQRHPGKQLGLRHSVSRTWFYLRNGGVRVVLHKVRRRLSR
jgi:GT2 family glycosyltransferase/glycosyltransferase involved in cell wall biosynthesis